MIYDSIRGQKLAAVNSDSYFLGGLEKAVDNLKAVLRYSTKEKAELLTSRMVVSNAPAKDFLRKLIPAITHFNVAKIDCRVTLLFSFPH